MLCRRNATGDLNRLVEVFRLDEIEAGEQLLGLGKWTIVELHLPVTDTHGRRRMHRMQRLTCNKPLAVHQFLNIVGAFTVGAGIPVLLIEINETKIFHTCLRRGRPALRETLKNSAPPIPNLIESMI